MGKIYPKFKKERHMAKKRGVNVSGEIRDLLKKNPDISAKKAAEILSGKGIKIALSQFYAQRKKGLASSNGTGGQASGVAGMVQKLEEMAKDLGGWEHLSALFHLVKNASEKK
jgi:hypothetical protein